MDHIVDVDENDGCGTVSDLQKLFSEPFMTFGDLLVTTKCLDRKESFLTHQM